MDPRVWRVGTKRYGRVARLAGGAPFVQPLDKGLAQEAPPARLGPLGGRLRTLVVQDGRLHRSDHLVRRTERRQGGRTAVDEVSGWRHSGCCQFGLPVRLVVAVPNVIAKPTRAVLIQ